MSQLSFLAIGLKGKKLRVERFLAEIEKAVPWKKLEKALRDFYYTSDTGRPRKELILMLKIHCLQQWYGLSDPGMEEAIYDRNSFQRFLKLDLMKEGVPDETTILEFRHFLEKHDLARMIFKVIQETLVDRGLIMKQGTIVDATIIEAPRSKQNKEKSRDPEMSSKQKNNRWYFGMKAHIGVDSESGLVHSVYGSTAKDNDVSHMDKVCHGQEKAVFGDRGYSSQSRKEEAKKQKVFWGIQRRAARGHPLTSLDRHQNKRLSLIRSKVEHPFQVIKCVWGYTKVRYRGIQKNTQQLYMLFGLYNIYKVRKKLIA